MSEGRLVPVGFMPKRQTTDFLAGVRGLNQVCSVSECIASAPPGATLEDRSGLGFYESEDSARAVVSAIEEAEYEVFAFRLLPEVFDERGRRNFDSATLPWLAGVDLSHWTSVGFDVVAGIS